jgi:nucleotide-binding universal stress UspA family protein
MQIMGLKDWLQKKIKLPATKEEDEMATTSPSKVDFKKENSKGILSEESKNPSDENTLEASESESAGKEEGIAGAEELSSMNQQRQQQPSSLEEMKMQQQDVELRSLETEHSQSSQSMREGQQSSLAATSSVSRQSSDPIPKYKMILVPHDGSEISDKALNHAIYLSKVSDAEILILNVLDRIGGKDSSAVLATMRRGEGEPDKANRDLEITMEGGVKQMIEEKMKLCKEAGVKSKVSYKIQTGKPLDEIAKLSEEMNIDLVVMASSRITSSIRVLGSTTRKVIGTIRKPVLVIHE